MSRLMKLAEALRDIAEESSKHEIEQALGLCRGFADRVSEESVGDAKGISLCPPDAALARKDLIDKLSSLSPSGQPDSRCLSPKFVSGDRSISSESESNV